MSDYERIASILRYLDQHHTEQPNLAHLARRVGLSRFHFHKLFSLWVGITPKDFLQCLTLSHVKGMLREGESVLKAALDTGLSGPSRLHDLCVSLVAASPGELKRGGAGWTIRAGFADCLFGTCLLGQSPRGICHLSFVDSTSRRSGAAMIKQEWPGAMVQWDDSAVSNLVGRLFQPPADAKFPSTLRAYVRGTAFQVRVWRALLCIPEGTLVSYGGLAESLGNRAAARVIATAVAKNPLAYLIPCHRVVRNTGVLGEYRWGSTRKKAIVAWESAAHLVAAGTTAAMRSCESSDGKPD